MKTLLVPIVMMLLSVACAACGSTSNDARSSSSTASTSRPADMSTSVPSSTVSSMGSLEVDEDDDDTAGDLRPHGDITKGDNDGDYDNDYKWQGGYYDGDDSSVRTYGHAASGAQKRALTTLAARYYAAAAAEDGVTACSMLTPAFANSVPEDYGHGSAGPSYLRSGHTCSAVMALLFQHSDAELAVPVEVIRVRVKGDEALVLVGSKVLPARELMVRREAGDWRIVGLLGLALP